MKTLLLVSVFSLCYSAEFSSPVRDVENPAKYAISTSCLIAIPPGASSGSCQFAFGVAGKSSIVTSVNFACLGENTNELRFNGPTINSKDGGFAFKGTFGTAVTPSAFNSEQSLFINNLFGLAKPGNVLQPPYLSATVGRYSIVGWMPNQSYCQVNVNGYSIP